MSSDGKPLRDRTLGEAQHECITHDDCDECPFNGDICNGGNGTIPSRWNLTDHPRFTEDEVADAKSIMRILGATKIERTEYGGNLCAVVGDIAKVVIVQELFPSILPGTVVELTQVLSSGHE